MWSHLRGYQRGTVFYRRRLPEEAILRIITLLAHGCPRQAIVAGFEIDERTVKSLEDSAGKHCQRVHEHLVEQPRDLDHVQGDEIRAKVQGAVLWIAMAIQVQTRLWLDGVLSTSRDTDLISTLIYQVRRWLRRTPAIAAGITDHRWTVDELLSFRVPPPRWKPPKRRGRPSNATKALVAEWCT